MDSLNPSSALKFFISSLPRLFPKTSWDFLLSLLPETSSNPPSLPANPLFDEDPVNDYAEELVVMKHVVQEMQALLSQSGCLTGGHYEALASHLPVDSSEENAVSSVCVWENTKISLSSRKVELLSPLLTMISKSDIPR